MGANHQSAGIEAFDLRFTGSGGEFFRVWIVNVLLSIVTLGFYTPFARRRAAQYFFGHTDVAGSPLEFSAQLVQVRRNLRHRVFGKLKHPRCFLATQLGENLL